MTSAQSLNGWRVSASGPSFATQKAFCRRAVNASGHDAWAQVQRQQQWSGIVAAAAPVPPSLLLPGRSQPGQGRPDRAPEQSWSRLMLGCLFSPRRPASLQLFSCQAGAPRFLQVLAQGPPAPELGAGRELGAAGGNRAAHTSAGEESRQGSHACSCRALRSQPGVGRRLCQGRRPDWRCSVGPALRSLHQLAGPHRAFLLEPRRRAAPRPTLADARSKAGASRQEGPAAAQLRSFPGKGLAAR